MGAAVAALGTLVAVTHPFPSILNGFATAAIALVAGSAPLDAATLGASMTALQASIGVTNDLADAERDAGRGDKPIADGRIGWARAIGLAVAAAIVGLLLAASVSGPTLGLGALGLAVGLAYDLVFKGTAWSWLPFAVGIPVLPAFAWVGATGALPPGYGLLAPAAFVAGAGLAVGNAVADIERDAVAEVETVATRWGRNRAWAVHAALLAVAVLGVGFGLASFGVGAAGLGLVLLGAGVALGGALLLRRDPGAVGRSVAWELEAVGVALAGAGWFVAMVP